MKTPISYIAIFLKGIAMGAADIVPGVSGGTIAFISGIYQEFIDSLKSLNLNSIKILFSKGIKPFWREINGNFLLSLFSGIIISIISLSKIIKYLLSDHPILLWSFFFGLIIASIYLIYNQIQHKTKGVFISILIGTIISYAITIIEPSSSVDSLPFLFLSGFIAIIAMILPGVSGAFILLLMGSYQTIINTINQLREAISPFDSTLLLEAFSKLGVFIIGAILGLMSFSRALSWLFKNHKNITLGVLTGFMIGSLNKIWPWKETISWRINSHDEKVPFIQNNISPFSIDNNHIAFALALMVIGFLVIFILEKFAPKEN